MSTGWVLLGLFVMAVLYARALCRMARETPTVVMPEVTALEARRELLKKAQAELAAQLRRRGEVA